MTIYIAGQMIDLSDPRLVFQLANASADSARIEARLTADLGGGVRYTIPEPHVEAIANSAAGRARLAQYPKQVQGWLVPSIWGNEPTAVEKEEENHGA